MGHPGAIPAKPPTFHLITRLVDSTGAAFAEKDYQLWWGGKLASEGVSGADGSVAADLDDRFDYGYLDLGEREGGKFVARLTIPIEVVPPPPPPPKPAKPPRSTPGRAPGEPHGPGPGGWTDEPDPSPPLPVPPLSAEDEEAWQRYEQQRREWEAWEKRRQQRMEEAERQRRRDEEMRRRREEEERRRKWSEGQDTPELPQEAPAPPMRPEDRDELERRLQRRREELHAGKVLLYEVAWRLRNLGYLPDSEPLVFPVEDAARARLLHALRRFAHKRGIPLPEVADLDGELSTDLKKLGDEIKVEHDG